MKKKKKKRKKKYGTKQLLELDAIGIKLVIF